ncbi:MAG: peptide chain release factor N(5)-glutamine methyltransferase [Candidatus Acidiferrales bacterium]
MNSTRRERDVSEQSFSTRLYKRSVREALAEAVTLLRSANVPSHALAAELLLMHVAGRDRTWIYAHPEALIDQAAAAKLTDLLARRIAGEPTQYLTGKQEFWGLEFEVTPAVLIPRPETEHVVEVTLERLGPTRRKSPLQIADVGTGSGCIAVALARELSAAKICATDISAAALEVACRNASRHGTKERVQFIQCNLLDGIDPGAGPFDAIVSNPPYIGRGEAETLAREIREHEPHEALFAGERGTEIYAPLIRQAEKLLAPEGVLVVELGFGAFEAVDKIVGASHAWTHVSVTPDLAGIPRVLAAERIS